MAGTSEPLPDHEIYDRESAASYIGSLFRHSWDESAEFWRTERKTLAIFLTTLVLGANAWAAFRGWEYVVDEFLLSTAISVGPSLATALLLYVWGVVKAPLALHRRDFERVKASKPKRMLRADVSPEVWQDYVDRLIADATGEDLAVVKGNAPRVREARPRVKISAPLVNRNNVHVNYFEAENFEQAVAVNVTAEIQIPDTDRLIRFSLPELSISRPKQFIPDMLKNGKPARPPGFWPLESFVKDARLEAYVSRATDAEMRLQGDASPDPDADVKAVHDGVIVEVGEKIESPIGRPLVVPFKVEYSNFDRTKRYASSHVLTYMPKVRVGWEEPESEITIELAEDSD